jgi:hypothetical protein
MCANILNTPKIIIAGPCAAESREQVFETAKGICELRITNYNFSGRGYGRQEQILMTFRVLEMRRWFG